MKTPNWYDDVRTFSEQHHELEAHICDVLETEFLHEWSDTLRASLLKLIAEDMRSFELHLDFFGCLDSTL